MQLQGEHETTCTAATPAAATTTAATATASRGLGTNAAQGDFAGRLQCCLHDGIGVPATVIIRCSQLPRLAEVHNLDCGEPYVTGNMAQVSNQAS